MKNEIWKDVLGYEGYYQVSNLGRIKSLDRYIVDSTRSRKQLVKGRLRKLKKNNRSYIMVSLQKDGKEKTKLIHRLVAESFIPNLNNYPQVNHKDENKNNNNLENLEWCTNLYNRRYGTGYQRSVDNHNYKEISRKLSKPVKQYNLNGEFIKEYYGVMEASRQNNICESAIRQVCYGKADSAGGYKWNYAL